MTFDYNRVSTDEDDVISSEIIVRMHTELLLNIIDHPKCPQEIKNMIDKRLGIIIPVFQDYVGIKEIIKPKLKDGEWELGQVVFKNGIRYPFIGAGTAEAFPELYKNE